VPRLERRDTLTMQLVEQMRKQIESGKFKNNQRLPSESEMIDAFGVSRTVVREAISNLKAIGMVATRQGVGAFVVRNSANIPFHVEEASLDMVQEVVAVLEVRIGLETEAAYLAASRRTSSDLRAMKATIDAMSRAIDGNEDGVEPDLQFHSAIARASGNKHFLSLFGYLGALLIPRSRVRAFKPGGISRKEFFSLIVREHKAIVRAIEARDGDAARTAMAVHLGGSKDRLLSTATGKQLRRRS
jgi:GntR family transcriptional regulator, transcriptional repressor for pyruvate dehydrogenase complex